MSIGSYLFSLQSQSLTGNSFIASHLNLLPKYINHPEFPFYF